MVRARGSRFTVYVFRLLDFHISGIQYEYHRNGIFGPQVCQSNSFSCLGMSFSLQCDNIVLKLIQFQIEIAEYNGLDAGFDILNIIQSYK